MSEQLRTTKLTVFADEYFFSVARMAPLRAAALSADDPRTTVSRSLAPVRVLLPILVTWSQSDMIAIYAVKVVVWC